MKSYLGEKLAYTYQQMEQKKKKDEPISGRYRCDMQGRKKTGARLVPVIINREISVIRILFAFEDEVSRERGLIDFYVTSNAS